MKTKIPALAIAIVAMAVSPRSLAASVIDDFNTGAQSVTIPDGAAGPASGGVACSGCVGGARIILVERTNFWDDAVSIEVHPASAAAGWFVYSNETGVNSQAFVRWDGDSNAF